jgi:hypothetical protein
MKKIIKIIMMMAGFAGLVIAGIWLSLNGLLKPI